MNTVKNLEKLMAVFASIVVLISVACSREDSDVFSFE